VEIYFLVINYVYGYYGYYGDGDIWTAFFKRNVGKEIKGWAERTNSSIVAQ
jgi:hypothetical protein